ncbi:MULTISPECIES: FAD binding domain-containing protein [Pseudonocardia]|uniref:6-hydroxypseudooxynicotine dehydrogenase complex subunit alpha n=2 Tax=Pseudonocardia TaxID=1847 RepID=A0A1Y2MSL1_PSEAH|nr:MULTISPECIES: FAD binding domain-containing protein [Pseudonocardia]OSY38205.1 6-hydroxypseudooxynicotine dehydrogenase complex subunit alpha [Pseudonocardia autotrophica]TDN71070.1 carbon-monoxide dehydrogenase medium subunit [Pseudonocardia autotrophica]BBG01739.1 carbon monoxide dehydrogenase [Pseudonocardia autotrophica]GEC27386.1 carbon monoxide dehydrogenase [Pseudonocardia saturnea]
MKCAPFDYVRAASVEETVKVLGEADGDGKILAGGQSLVPVLALRMARPAVLVDVNRIPGLSSIRRIDDTVEVGATVRHSRLAEQTEHPLLAEAARWIGHTAIRSRGTAGGSIAHADPSAELPVVAVATGATVTVTGPRGSRDVDAEELFVGALTTSIEEDEMITAIRFPQPDRWGFAEFARRHGDFALVTAVVTEVRGRPRITFGGVGSVPQRAAAAEQALADRRPAAEIAHIAAEEIEPTADLHGSVEFRRAIATEMTRRALAQFDSVREQSR